MLFLRTDLKARDPVALTVNRLDLGLYRGQVGQVAEALGAGVFLVELQDVDRRPYARAALPAAQLMKLRYGPPESPQGLPAGVPRPSHREA